MMLPPHRMTSRDASARADCPRQTYSTPTARRPSTRMRQVSALVMTRQIRALQGGPQERARGAPAPPVLLGELVEAAAVLAGAVEVGVRGHAGLLGGGDEHLGQRMAEPMVGHVERAAAGVEAVFQPLVVLGLPEERQHVLVAPALVAELGPVIVVRGVAPDVDHVVDRAGPAERPPAGPREAPQVAVELGHGAIPPVMGSVRQEPHHRGRVDEAARRRDHPPRAARPAWRGRSRDDSRERIRRSRRRRSRSRTWRPSWQRHYHSARRLDSDRDEMLLGEPKGEVHEADLADRPRGKPPPRDARRRPGDPAHGRRAEGRRHRRAAHARHPDEHGHAGLRDHVARQRVALHLRQELQPGATARRVGRSPTRACATRSCFAKASSSTTARR